MTSLNMVLNFLMNGIFLAMMVWAFGFRFVSWEHHNWLYWITVFLLTDLAYWFVHWLGHAVRFFWAVHSVHHSSEKFNITVGFRSSVFEPLYRGFFFLPLAFLGFGAADIMLAFALQQLYGSLIHTTFIKKLGICEYFLVTPSHHRVHHGSNTRYLDKNMGMIFIFWDKLFGTFEPEDAVHNPVKFGLTKNLETYNPAVVLFSEWKTMIADVRKAPGLYNKFMYVFGPPGWSHDGSRMTSAQIQAGEVANMSVAGK